jgi:CSLREA domain-containing protein
MVALLATLATAKNVTPAYAGGVAGNGTPGSCTEAALDAALAGGGVVNFNCGAASQGTTFVVNSVFDLPDPFPGNGICEVTGDPSTCTLRAAIQSANGTPGHDTITFADSLPSPAVFTLSRMGNDDTALNGDLDITDDLTLIGRGASQTIIDGYGYDRVLHVISGSALITGLTIRNGRAEVGGGIRNLGVLMVTHSTISNNRAESASGGYGGGIYNSGVLTVTHSIISGNPGLVGGGVFVAGSMWLDQSAVQGNYALASGVGSGLWNEKALTITNSTVSGNQGGGIVNRAGAQLWAWNSTFDGNTSAVNGGGIDNSGQVNLYNVTISHNVADSDDDGNGTGGGVFNFAGSTFNTRNTLLAVNYRGITPLLNDCYGQVWSDHSRFTSVPVGCSIVGPSSFTTDPNGIGPLADNGGPTLTVALLPGSDAIDAADPVQGCVNFNSVLTTDQRGAARVAGVRCDVGAYEFGSLLPALFLPLVMR